MKKLIILFLIISYPIRVMKPVNLKIPNIIPKIILIITLNQNTLSSFWSFVNSSVWYFIDFSLCIIVIKIILINKIENY